MLGVGRQSSRLSDTIALDDPVAQWIEHQTSNLVVVGSSPTGVAISEWSNLETVQPLRLCQQDAQSYPAEEQFNFFSRSAQHISKSPHNPMHQDDSG